MLRSLPPFLLGILLAAYWGRVLRMAHKAHRRTGRAGNIVPGEKLGALIRIIWTPVVIVWVAHPFLVAFATHLPAALRPLYFAPALAWPALVVAGACLVFSRIFWKAMGRNWRMGIDPGERNPLIASGPFAHVRHPIYALSMLMMLATMTMIPSPLTLAVGCVHIALLAWEARREERHLLRIHGETYRAYQRRVGGFVPHSTNSK